MMAQKSQTPECRSDRLARHYVEPYAQVYCVGRMKFDNCFDKQGKLVKTAYPKDLILAHYDPLVVNSSCPQRWRWQDEKVL